jgi:hypothetical protein
MSVRLISEPHEVFPESEFQGALVGLIRLNIRDDSSFLVVPSFGLDLAVFDFRLAGPRISFIEVKSFAGQRQGGLPFGAGKGLGPQVYMLGRDRAPLFSRLVRWAFADGTLPVGTARYCLLDCDIASNAAMGGALVGKCNNFRVAALREHFVVWSIFCNALLSFLQINASNEVQRD